MCLEVSTAVSGLWLIQRLAWLSWSSGVHRFLHGCQWSLMSSEVGMVGIHKMYRDDRVPVAFDIYTDQH